MDNTFRHFPYPFLAIVIAVALPLALGLLLLRRQRALVRYESTGHLLSLFLPIVVAGIASVATITAALFQNQFDSPNFPSIQTTSDRFQKLQDAIADLERRNNLTDQALKAATAAAGTDPNKPFDIRVVTELQRDISSLKKASEKFESLLLSDAERLLTLPLLKRDLDVFRSEIVAMKGQMELETKLLQEAQSQVRWIIGTLGLGMFALVVPIAKSALSKGKALSPRFSGRNTHRQIAE